MPPKTKNKHHFHIAKPSNGILLVVVQCHVELGIQLGLQSTFRLSMCKQLHPQTRVSIPVLDILDETNNGNKCACGATTTNTGCCP